MTNEQVLQIQNYALQTVVSALAAKAGVTTEVLKKLLDQALAEVTEVFMDENNEIVN